MPHEAAVTATPYLRTQQQDDVHAPWLVSVAQNKVLLTFLIWGCLHMFFVFPLQESTLTHCICSAAMFVFAMFLARLGNEVISRTWQFSVQGKNKAAKSQQMKNFGRVARHMQKHLRQYHDNQITAAISERHVENLVFEGGGVLGVAYGGVMLALQELQALGSVKRCAGTSAGAMQALMFALGFTPRQMATQLLKFEFSKLLDAGDFPLLQVPYRFITKFGIFAGDYLLNFLREQVKRQTGNPDMTFEEFEAFRAAHPERNMKEVHLVATNLTTRYSHVFSAETTPKCSLAQAVRMSMSLPIFFQSLSWDDCRYVDGGVINTFPINMFDYTRYVDPKWTPEREDERVRNDNTLGFHLGTAAQNAELRDSPDCERHATKTPVADAHWLAYLSGLFNSLNNVQVDEFRRDHDNDRTVFIDVGKVKSTDFHLSNADKHQLQHAGMKATVDFFMQGAAVDSDNELQEESDGSDMDADADTGAYSGDDSDASDEDDDDNTDAAGVGAGVGAGAGAGTSPRKGH